MMNRLFLRCVERAGNGIGSAVERLLEAQAFVRAHVRDDAADAQQIGVGQGGPHGGDGFFAQFVVRGAIRHQIDHVHPNVAKAGGVAGSAEFRAFSGV